MEMMAVVMMKVGMCAVWFGAGCSFMTWRLSKHLLDAEREKRHGWPTYKLPDFIRGEESA